MIATSIPPLRGSGRRAGAARDDAARAGTAPEDHKQATLRERKKRATRIALQRSARTLVARHGLAAVTVEDIAAAADVSTRTFFNYFPSKEDAVIGWDPARIADMAQRLRARPAGEAPPAALRAVLIEAYAPAGADYRDLLAKLRVTRSDPHLLAHQVSRWADTERLLVAALAERRGTDAASDHYAALVVATMLSAGRVAMMSWCDTEGRVPLAQELAANFDVVGAGLAEPERSTL